MPCTPFRTENGATGFACGPRQRCKCELRRPMKYLCDWKVGDGKTCDRPLCDRCTSKPAPDKDLCPAHQAEWAARRAK